MIDITKKIKEYYRNNVDKIIIYHFINILRNYKAHYYLDKYALEKLGNLGKNKIFTIDESLFVHIDGDQISVMRYYRYSKSWYKDWSFF